MTKVTVEYYLGFFVSSITGHVIPMPSNAKTAVPMKLTQVVTFIRGLPPSDVSMKPIPLCMFLMPQRIAKMRIEISPIRMQISAAR